jgi:hypothetical protein
LGITSDQPHVVVVVVDVSQHFLTKSLKPIDYFFI